MWIVDADARFLIACQRCVVGDGWESVWVYLVLSGVWCCCGVGGRIGREVRKGYLVCRWCDADRRTPALEGQNNSNVERHNQHRYIVNEEL